MTVTSKTIKTEIQLPADILYSLGIDKTRIEYFVKKNFLLELYREGRIKNFKDTLDDLQKGGFWMNADLYKRMLKD